jgi:hypothetical protein
MSPRPLHAGALATLAASIVLSGQLAGTALASAGTVVSSGAGLTQAQGLTRSDDGALWVADHLKGICRVALTPQPALVEDDYCAVAHVGPKAPLGLTFDAVTDNFYVGDAASNNGSIWRLHWDAETRAIDSATRMLSLPGDRAAGLTLVPAAAGSAPDVVYATKRSAALLRIAGPSGLPQEPVTVGFAGQQSPLALAFLDGKIYIAEDAHVTRVALGGGGPAVAAPVPGLPALAGALVADPVRHRLYAGTLNGTLSDRVDALDATTGLVELYESGFAGVSALALEPSGELLVADDPGAATGALDSADQGRIYRVPVSPLGRPVARIDAGPAAVTRLRTALFRFSGPLGATFQCRMDATPWAPCPALGMTAEYADLPDGQHRFEVRALTDLTGRPAARAFLVDTIPPRVTIAPAPAPPKGLRTSTVTADLLADEPGVDFSCSVDDGPFAPCDSALVLSGLQVGPHKLSVLGTDAAGNMSDPLAAETTWSFEVLPPPPAPPVPSTTTPATTTTPTSPTPPAQSGDFAPVPTAASAGDTSVAAAGLVAPLPRPLLHPVALRPVRVPRSRVRHAGLWLRLRLQTPPGAQFAHVAIRGRAAGAARIRELVVRDLPLKQAGPTRLEFRLTRAEARRLRPGLHLVTVALGTEGGALGNVQAHWFRVLAR